MYAILHSCACGTSDQAFILVQESKNFSLKNQKGFSDGLSYSTSQKSKEQRAIPLPILSPIPSMNGTEDG